jgi:hypothetical protein
MASKRNIRVHVVSDATGITAERVIQAVLVQFDQWVEPTIQRHAHVKTTRQLERILNEAERREGVVIYSLVTRSLREWMDKESSRRDIEIIDLLGQIMTRMTRRFRVMPSMHPGLLTVAGEESIRLAESIDFTLKHDDGAHPETLGRAKIILVGVSRTSKTPTSLYLACNQNIKVANVPIVRGVDPPAKLFKLKRPTLIGLTISPEKLVSVRQKRFSKTPVDDYMDVQSVRRELAACHQIFERIPNLRVIDVTNRSIEEIASRIVEHDPGASQR